MKILRFNLAIQFETPVNIVVRGRSQLRSNEYTTCSAGRESCLTSFDSYKTVQRCHSDMWTFHTFNISSSDISFIDKNFKPSGLMCKLSILCIYVLLLTLEKQQHIVQDLLIFQVVNHWQLLVRFIFSTLVKYSQHWFFNHLFLWCIYSIRT